MRKLNILVTFMLLAINAEAGYREHDWQGFDTNAWPSYVSGKGRWGDTNKLVLITNIWAYRSKTTYTVTNTEYRLPGWTSNGYTYNADPYIQEVFFSDPAGLSNSVVSPVRVAAGWPTNYFRFAVTSDQYYAMTTNLTTAGFGSERVAWITVSYNGQEYDIIESLKLEAVEWRQTNLVMNAADVRGLDCYLALNYLDDFVTDSVSSKNLLRFIWQNEWENLKGIKAVLKSFVDKTPGSATVSAFGCFTNKSSAPRSTLFYTTNAVGWLQTNVPEAPTNFFEYTPFRGLDGRGGLPRVLTNYYTIDTESSGVVTQYFTDYLMNTNTAIGTNGQEFSVIVTNLNVMPGYYTHDYGWKFVDDVISKMRYVRYGFDLYWANTSLKADSYTGHGNESTYAAALAGAQSDWHSYTNLTSSNTFKNVGVRFYGDPVRTGSRYIKDTNTEVQVIDMIKETADSCIILPVFPVSPLSNRAANVYLYYNSHYPLGGTTNGWTYTNSLFSQLSPSNKFSLVASVPFGTNVAWGTGGATDLEKYWFEIAPTTGVSSVFNSDYPPVAAETPGNSTNVLGWNATGVTAHDSEYIIFDWQHPWINVCTN